jgi:hypothetical protein
MPTKHTHGLLAQTAFFRPADGLHVTDFAIGVDKELHEDGAFDLVVDSIVRIPKVFVEEMRPGGVAAGVGGFDRLLGAVSLCFIMSCGGVQDEGKVDQKAIESGKTAKLIIKREKNILSGIAANVNVYINETPRGYVSNGEERSFDFYPTESGLVNIRLESSLASSGRATEKVLVASKYLDSSWHTNYTYEEKMKASAGDEFEYFCTFNPELFVRKVEKEIK